MILPKLSIIVPIYNVEQYLRECIDSILKQTFTDFELLLVDDGSTDNSGSICEEYAEKDVRIRVFHKENGGVSSARNKGLDEARGEWIAFIDGDDWISPMMYENLMAFSSHDVVLGGYIERKKNKDISVPFLLPKGQVKDIFLLLSSIIGPKELGKSVQMAAIWLGIFRRRIIGENRFLTLRLCEDKLFLIKLILLNPSIYIIDECLYNYRANQESATTKYSETLINDLTEVQRLTKNILEEYKVRNIFQNEIDNVSLYFLEMIFYNEARSTKKSLLKSSIEINRYISDLNIDLILDNTKYIKLSQFQKIWIFIKFKMIRLGLNFLRIKLFVFKSLYL